MKKRIVFLMICLAPLLLFAQVRKPIKMKKVPKVVKENVAFEFPGFEIKSVIKVLNDGPSNYEFTLVSSKEKKTVQYRENGKRIWVRQFVEPKPARDTSLKPQKKK